MQMIKHTLANGLRVLLVPRPDSIATNILVLVEAGSKYETKDTSGLSHFLEHMCFKGTPKRPKAIDISTEFDSLGAQYNAFTSQEYTGYWVTVQPKFLERAMELIADMYLNPTYPEAEIEKEKGVIIEEINMYEDLPMQRVQEFFMELLYGNQPAGWSIAGRKETVRQLNRPALFAYREKHYLAPATTVVVSGSFAEEGALKLSDKFFSAALAGNKINKVPVAEKQDVPQVSLKNKPSDQTHLILGVRSYPLNHPDYFGLELLGAILGGGMSSRLFHRIRDELGAAYYVRASNDAFTDHGLLQASVGADNSRVKQIITIILEEFKKLQLEQVPAEELRRVKDSLVGNLYLGLETVASLGLFYGLQELLKHKVLTPSEITEKIEEVNAEKIQELAAKIFINQHLNLALIGPFDSQEQFAAALKLE
jgi:predicted Zn-dependent peptidase